MTYPLENYLKKICEKPLIKEIDAWTTPRIIPCGKCKICKKNKILLERGIKNANNNAHVCN